MKYIKTIPYDNYIITIFRTENEKYRFNVYTRRNITTFIILNEYSILCVEDIAHQFVDFLKLKNMDFKCGIYTIENYTFKIITRFV